MFELRFLMINRAYILPYIAYVFLYVIFVPDLKSNPDPAPHLPSSLYLLFSSLPSQSRMWSGISEWPISQHRLCFWHGLNQLEIDLSLKFSGLMIKQIKLLLTLPITSLVWMLESITHSASLLWQQINQQKATLSACQTIPVCKIIKYLFCAS